MSQRPAATAYLVDIAHVRRTPLVNRFRYRSCSWLVDLDGVGRDGRVAGLGGLLGRLLRFRASDHLGDPSHSWRANVEQFAASHGVDVTQSHIQALTGARTWGYAFNPLTLYWCTAPDGQLECTIAEVHNTYGGEHTYMIAPSPEHRARVEKAFYVSPFNRVEGHYEMHAPPPGERLDVTMTLHAPGQAPFVATWRGTRARPGDRLAVGLRSSFATQLMALQIRRQGIALWLRRLPVVPRPTQEKETA